MPVTILGNQEKQILDEDGVPIRMVAVADSAGDQMLEQANPAFVETELGSVLSDIRAELRRMNQYLSQLTDLDLSGGVDA